MFRNVYLEGELGDRYGTEFRMKANTMQDAFKCLIGNFDDFRAYLLDCQEKNIGFACHVAGTNISNEKELFLRFPKGDMIISPQPVGAKSDFGKALAVIAAVVIVVATAGTGTAAAGGGAAGGTAGGTAAGTTTAATTSAATTSAATTTTAAGGTAGGASLGASFAKYMGVSLATVGINRLLMPDPATDSQQDSSYLFQGSQHNMIEGDPVPVLYGELRIPGRPVSTVVRNETSYFYNGHGMLQVPTNTGALNPGESCGGGGSNTVEDREPGDPNAVEDNFTCAYESTVTGNVLSNDTHPEGLSFSVDGYDDPEYGYFTATGVASDGAFTYNAPTDFVGVDSFYYSVIDTDGNTHGARVYIDVQSPGDITAVDDYYTTEFETAISGNVLDNDTHSGSLSLTAQLSYQYANEPSDVLTLSSNGDFTYTPSSGFSGDYAFVYRAEDETGRGAIATATITVLEEGQSAPTDDPTNTPPSVQNKRYDNQTYGAIVTGNLLTDSPAVLDVDGDSLTVSIPNSGLPNKGTVTLGANGAFTYEPNAPFEGSDTFTFIVSDGTDFVSAFATIIYNPEVTDTTTPNETPGDTIPDYPESDPQPGIQPGFGAT